MNGRAIAALFKVNDQIIFSAEQPSKDRNGRLTGTFVAGKNLSKSSANISAEELGQIILAVLDKSKKSGPTDDDPIIRDKEWQKSIAKEAGFTKWLDFRREVLHVNVYKYENDDIEVCPTIHDGSGFSNWIAKMETFQNPSAEQMGHAAQRAFSLSK